MNLNRANVRQMIQDSDNIPSETEALDTDNLYTIHRLAILLGNDRRTIGNRLSGVEPDLIKGKRKYYSLNRVKEILDHKAKNSKERQGLEIKKLIAQAFDCSRYLCCKASPFSNNLTIADSLYGSGGNEHLS